MSIILQRNFDGAVVDNFAAEIARRTSICCRKGIYNFVYIVPTRRRVRELQRELVGDVVLGRLPVYTLELFAREVFARLRSGKRVISPSMQGMIVSEVLSNSDFKFFRYLSFRPGGRRGVAPPGTIKKIVDQIDYLRENGITPDDYRKMLVGAEESERPKLEEFLRIYEGYEASLGSKMIDNAGMLSLVNRGISEKKEEILDDLLPNSGTTTFFVEGFYNFKKPELDFLSILSSRKRFSFLVDLDCIDANENLFKMMLGTAGDLTARGFRRIETSRRRVEPGENLREHFASYLFNDSRAGKKLNLENRIFVTAVEDKLREVEFVAEKIKELIQASPGQKLDSICVASYLPQDYSQIVREVFAKFRIPANITDRLTLESNGVVNAVLSFIDIRLADYERSALLRAITNRSFVVNENFAPSMAGSIIYDAAVLCRFERGLKSFKEAIARRLDLIGKLGRDDPDADEIETRRNEQTLKQAQTILESVESKLRPFTKEMSPSEFLSGIKSLLNSLGVHESVIKINVANVATEIVERDAKALSAFLEVIEEVADIEAARGTGKIGLDIWMEKLRAALSLTRYNVRQKYGYGVYVTSLEEIRGLEFDYLFILGLNEGNLPAKYSPDIFLPLVSQRENREMQPYLQRHLFYQAIGSFRKALYLIHAVRSNDVRLIKSSFIDAVLGTAVCSRIDDTKDDRPKGIYNIQQAIESAPGILERAKAGIKHALPPNLDRCKEAELSRYRDDKESEFHGRIAAEDSVKHLSKEFSGRVFSAAQLESLARCGFQYFARRILQIAEVPDIEASLSAIERGAVLHRILFRFYSTLSRVGKLENAKNELGLLLEIGKMVLDELGINHDLFEIEREIILGGAGVKGTLELFLEKVQSKLTEYGFHPGVFELGFGMSKRLQPFDETSAGNEEFPAVRIGRFLLRGKIDRIDSSSNGLTIFDYKTSSVVSTHKDVVGDKIAPQLLLYLNAMQQISNAKKNEAGELNEIALKDEPASAAFISINRDMLVSNEDGKNPIRFIVQKEGEEIRYNSTFGSDRRVAAADAYPKTMNELMTSTESFFNRKISEAATGRFNLTDFPYERVCTYCPYSEACRIALTHEAFTEEESI